MYILCNNYLHSSAACLLEISLGPLKAEGTCMPVITRAPSYNAGDLLRMASNNLAESMYILSHCAASRPSLTVSGTWRRQRARADVWIGSSLKYLSKWQT